MQTRNRNTFTTIHTEGALLPVDLLQRIAERPALDGLTPGRLPPGPGREAQRGHQPLLEPAERGVGRFQTRAARAGPETDTGTTLTRERWLLPLFRSWVTGA